MAIDPSKIDNLPEGGPATVPDTTAPATPTSKPASFQALKEEAQGLAGTAKTAARNAAVTGKDRAADALSDAATYIEDAARTLDEKIGNGVGDYARRAGTAATNLSDTLRNKDVEEIVEDAKDTVRRNPALAVGIAAAAGFLLTRVFRLGGKSGNA